MIEFATMDNGPTDLPIRLMPSGMTLPEGDLHAMHESRQRAVIRQTRKGILADELGFNYYFLTEHHFQAEGAEFSPNPLVVGAALATATKHIRIGQMANILLWHHPIRLAEQAAMVDVLSGGRLEFGIGRGIQPRETEIFGQVYGGSALDEPRSRAYFNEALEIIIKAWTEPSFSYHGDFFSIPPKWTSHHHPMTIEYFSQPEVGRTVDDVLQIGEGGEATGIRSRGTVLKELSVFPQPLQKPYPQIWQPITGNLETLRRAARAGYNACFLSMDFDKVARDVEMYMTEAEQHSYPDSKGRGAFKYGWDSEKKRGVFHGVGIHITEFGLGDMERAAVAGRHTWNYLAPFGAGAPSGQAAPAAASENRPRFTGSCGQILEGLMKLKEAGRYEDFLCNVNFGGAGAPFEWEEAQMRCFASEIMPRLIKECGGSPPQQPSEVVWRK